MKFKILVEYEYPIEHKLPVKAELILHGDRVVTDNIKWIEQEPKTGHWVKYDMAYFTTERLTGVIHSIRECSECHTKIADFCGEMKYCPNCGCHMVEPQESEVEDGTN